MNKRFGGFAALILALAAALLLGGGGAQAAPAPDPHALETKAQRDARMAWWRQARFGLFIHWGLYAVPAGEYNGKPVGGIGEWIMNSAKIPVATYAGYAKEFNPQKFNADEWVRVAKDAGMKYVVMTAKHHDGFALFHSQSDPYNIYDATPFKRDPIAEMAAACKKAGLPFGVYYSQAQDWHHAGGAAYGGHWDPAQDGDLHAYVRTVAAPQVAELLTRYHPAVLWWDTPVDMTQADIQALTAAFAQDLELIANNRLGNGVPGDTETPEQTVPATGYGGRDWETCMTLNDTWGYKKDDTNFKSVPTLVQTLVDIASKGGNYLLNVGPDATGTIPAPEVSRLRAVGAWLKVNGAGIYGTSASPFKALPWGRCTQKRVGADTVLYLHVFQWPADGKLFVPGLLNAVRSASLLPSGGRLAAVPTGSGVAISVPKSAPDPTSSTVVLQIAGSPDVAPISLTPDARGVLTLPALDAETHGALHYESGNGHDNLGFWTDPKDWAEWSVKIARPGPYTVTAEIASMGSGKFTVNAFSTRQLAALLLSHKADAPVEMTLDGTAPNTGDYTKFQTVTLGTLMLSAGVGVISVHPVAAGWAPLNLKRLTLTPGR